MSYKDPRARAEYNRRYREKNRETLNAYMRDYWKRRYDQDEQHREKVKARAKNKPRDVAAAQQRVYNAVKRGEIIRPEHCEECGKAGRVEAAHKNYVERLAIRWLCRSCHRRWDRAHPKT